MYLFAGFTDTRANLNTLYKLDLKTFYWSRADGLSHPNDASDNEDTEDEEAAQIREKKRLVYIYKSWAKQCLAN